MFGDDFVDSLSIRDEIDKLARELSIPYEGLHEISKKQWVDIQYRIEEKFLKKEHHAISLHWGWEHFKEPTYSLAFTEPAYRYFNHLIEDEDVWFIVEDYMDKIWLYEGRVSIIVGKVIPECCHLNEYYLVSKKYEWILCEDHHNIVHGSGTKVFERMRKFKLENREEIID